MEDFFVINDAIDGKLTIKAKIEANIMLASITKDHGWWATDEGSSNLHKLHALINIAKALDDHHIVTDVVILETLKDIVKLIEIGPLSPLTLKDDEFKVDDSNSIATVYENKRYCYLDMYINHVDGSRMYVNHKAFVATVKVAYSHAMYKQVTIPDYHIIEMLPKIYITKGGVVTGEFIKTCYILEEDIKNESFNKFIPVHLNISLISLNYGFIYTIDNRDPNLRLLQSMYNVPIMIDKDIKGKYDIRKYNKINK